MGADFSEVGAHFCPHCPAFQPSLNPPSSTAEQSEIAPRMTRIRLMSGRTYAPGGVRSTPYDLPVQQSDHAPRMTRTRVIDQAGTTRHPRKPADTPPPPQPKAPPSGSCDHFPFGGRPKVLGTPGTRLKNARKPLSPLVFYVPGSTGNRPKMTGNTGNKWFQYRPPRCGTSDDWSCWPWSCRPGRHFV